MAGLRPSGRALTILLVLLFGQFVLMSSSVRNAAGRTLLEQGVFRVSDPVLDVAREVGGGVRGVTSGVNEVRQALDENRRLRIDLQRARAELDRQREQAVENGRLRRLLEMRTDLAPKSVAASVLTGRLDPESRVLLLDKGEDDGLKPQLGVVGWGGAVGKVIAVDHHRAKVQLLADQNSGVGGLIQRSRVGGIVYGQRDGSLKMSFVPTFADVALGDRVVTSGLEGIFPKGYGIGTVVQVRGAGGASKTVVLRPEVDPAGLEEVLVLLEAVGGPLLAPPEPAPPAEVPAK
ncbi:MAG TPA: rod shape-determining protein MreC [Candidatus Polarisedimenticolaceae bacterium]|nr:rod shape-determining protein MreC [Candidatus Polarisedimenticolaceae bacterium]